MGAQRRLVPALEPVAVHGWSLQGQTRGRLRSYYAYQPAVIITVELTWARCGRPFDAAKVLSTLLLKGLQGLQGPQARSSWLLEARSQPLVA